MSFSFEFCATRKDAEALIAREHAPECVKTFVTTALSAFKEDALVAVMGYGHLFNHDHPMSNAVIEVREIVLKRPT